MYNQKPVWKLILVPDFPPNLDLCNSTKDNITGYN